MFGLDGVIPLVVVGFFLFMAVLAIFLPLFVWQIRDSSRRTERLLKQISSQLPSPPSRRTTKNERTTDYSEMWSNITK